MYVYSLNDELQRWLVRNDAQRQHENDPPHHDHRSSFLRLGPELKIP